MGAISSSIYNWLTEFDLLTSYSFLPVKVSTVIKSKIRSYLIINILSIIILTLVAWGTNQFNFFLPAIVSLVSVSSYILSITVYLTGLYPNIMLYNAKILLEFLVLIVPILLILIFLSVISISYILTSLILIPISFYLIKEGYKKWDSWEQQTF
jgi:hypothetical protein